MLTVGRAVGESGRPFLISFVRVVERPPHALACVVDPVRLDPAEREDYTRKIFWGRDAILIASEQEAVT